jgi:two-component system, LuxR family, response regulator FixJ
MTMNERPSAGAVYVVDDDPDVLSSLRFLFEAEGFRVETFADGADLLAAPLPRPQDCLLIDYKLGGVDGLEVVRRLRELKVTAPVVLITVYEGLEKRAAALGVRDVLLKPHLDESVVLRVRSAIAAAGAADDLR